MHIATSPSVRVPQDPEILGTVNGYALPRLLSEYPKILRYSDHPGTVHGWALQPPCQSIPRSRDTLTILRQYMDGHFPHPLPSEYLEIPRYSDNPGTVRGWVLHPPCQSIPRSQDTLTIPGQYMDGHRTPLPPVRVSRDPEILV